MIVPHNIYIHVPFCASKCNYCAFFSHACKNPDWHDYEKNIINEIEFWADTLGSISVPTIFFGGGTPSFMPNKTFNNIIQTLTSKFKLSSDCEITLEANPGTIDEYKLNSFIQIGVNRLSIGVQSLNDNTLQFLGRRHDTKTAIKLIETVQKKPIKLSADFIYGLPDETVSDIIETCKNINSLGLTHCSMYELTIEPGTPFSKMNLQMPSNDEMADMYCAISETLHLPRYEVSNYATPGNECIHNLNIWDGQAYIGIGQGAAGRILIDNQWYEQMGGGKKFEKLSTTARAEERIITGIRQVRGVYLDSQVKKIINMQYVKSNPDLFQFTSDDRLAATEKGMLILDDLTLNLVR